MRFALLGDHRDGLAMARALADSSRHEVALYSGPAEGKAELERLGLETRLVQDLEEALGHPDVEAVIVAGNPSIRPAQLKRALQSQLHVLCVHPADQTPDLGYEAGVLETDAGCALLPILPETQHPGLRRFAQIARALEDSPRPPRVLEVERWSEDELLIDAGLETCRPALPGWDALRMVGGELATIFLLSGGDDLLPGETLVLTGRFESGLFLQARYLPGQAEARYRLTLIGTTGTLAQLEFERGWPGPATLTFMDEKGQQGRESWASVDPWAALVARFEAAVAEAIAQRRRPEPGTGRPESCADLDGRLGWQDEIRALELDDAARRSIERGRSSALEHVEASEDANFKSTMTLVGCGLLWSTIVLLILSIWLPKLGWVIFPIFALFLGLQIFRWIVPQSDDAQGPVS